MSFDLNMLFDLIKKIYTFIKDMIFLYIFIFIIALISYPEEHKLDYFFNLIIYYIGNNTICNLLIIAALTQVIAVIFFTVIRWTIKDKLLNNEPLKSDISNDNFTDEIKSILGKGKDNNDDPLIKISEVIQENYYNTKRKVSIYKWSCLLVPTLIPILSAILSISIASKDTFNFINTPWLSALITLITILNSMFQPSERFRKSCLIGIQLEHHKIKFLERIKKYKEIGNNDAPKKSKEYDSIISDYSDIMSKIQENLIDLFAPKAEKSSAERENYNSKRRT